MTTQEHLLTLVMEECAETAQRASKAIRFGLTEVQPGQPHDNIMRMMIEYTDLVAVFEVMMEEGMLTSALQEDLERHHEAKKVKIREQMELSRKMGTLEPKKSLWQSTIEEFENKRKNDLLKAHGFADEDHSKLSDTTWNCYNSGCRLKCNDCPDKGLTLEEVAAKHHHNGLTERPCTVNFMPTSVKMEAKVGDEVKRWPEFPPMASRGVWNPPFV